MDKNEWQFIYKLYSFELNLRLDETPPWYPKLSIVTVDSGLSLRCFGVPL